VGHPVEFGSIAAHTAGAGHLPTAIAAAPLGVCLFLCESV